jgi:hypothetical protein
MVEDAIQEGGLLSRLLAGRGKWSRMILRREDYCQDLCEGGGYVQ